jgi:hypothetical protein
MANSGSVAVKLESIILSKIINLSAPGTAVGKAGALVG